MARFNGNSFRFSWEEQKSHSGTYTTICGIGLLLLVILLPLSFSYVEYHEYGLKQRKSTGTVDVSKVYDSGRYAIGPDYTFIKYQADAHVLNLDGLSVFSASGGDDSIGLEFVLDLHMTYTLQKDKIGELHTSMATSYQAIVSSRAKDAVKNRASIDISFTDFFENRESVETILKAAVTARWADAPALPAVLDQFHIGRIKIPENVARKQLETKLQNERNGKETSLQKALVERELTKVEVSKILNEKEKTLRTAQAEATRIKAKAVSDAQKTVLEAQSLGLKDLIADIGIDALTVGQNDGAGIAITAARKDKLKVQLDYIRALRNRKDETNIDITFLNGGVKTFT